MTGIPPIDQSLLPAEVRNGTAKDKQTYSAALGFERALMGELTKAMADTAKPIEADDTSSGDSGDSGDDTGSSTDAATSMYTDMLPDQLADGLEQNGGLGLAKTFYDSLKEQAQ
jgi:Rod binding domain-containing protein